MLLEKCPRNGWVGPICNRDGRVKIRLLMKNLILFSRSRQLGMMPLIRFRLGRFIMQCLSDLTVVGPRVVVGGRVLVKVIVTVRGSFLFGSGRGRGARARRGGRPKWPKIGVIWSLGPKTRLTFTVSPGTRRWVLVIGPYL